MTILGREAYLPSGTSEWFQLGAILALAAICLVVASGWSTAILGVGAAFAGYLYDHHLYLPVVVAAAGAIAIAMGVRAGRAPAGWRAAHELILLVTGFIAYEIGRAEFVGLEHHAAANARRIIDFERRIGLSIEEPIQKWILQSDQGVRAFNWIYSFAFLSLVLGALFYLYVADEQVYRVFRTSLGVSALLALVTIALFPVAPPRLMPESGMFDTHELAGLSHGFVNPFAAMPSLHVGWVALAGFSLALATRGIARIAWAGVPVTVMTLTVMATGNHYWLDGVVGSGFSLIPALLLSRTWVKREGGEVAVSGRLPEGIRLRPLSIWPASVKTRFSLATLGTLLTYLLIRQAVDPGFTDYWGYMVGQIAASMVILAWLDDTFSPEGGLSWLTHLVVIINTWADSLGTAAHLYARYVSYDKITHFLGGIMLTAAAADIILAIRQRRGKPAALIPVLACAVAISIGLGTGWEIYEYLGDRLFDTGRHAGAVDTAYDLVSDSVGAIVSVMLLWRWRSVAVEQQERAGSPVPNPR